MHVQTCNQYVRLGLFLCVCVSVVLSVCACLLLADTQHLFVCSHAGFP